MNLRLVGGLVVENDVHVQVLGHGLVDQVQEPAELLGAMPGRHIGDDLARGDVERRVEVRGAIALVIVGAPFGRATQLIRTTPAVVARSPASLVRAGCPIVGSDLSWREIACTSGPHGRSAADGYSSMRYLYGSVTSASGTPARALHAQ